MKRLRFISLVNSLFLFSNVCALTLKTQTFSPDVVENGTANVPKLLQALKVVQQNKKFTLPTMPESLTAEGKEIIRAAGDTGNVNIMAMDYGTVYAGDTGSYAVEATISLHQFLQEVYPEKLPQSLWQFIEIAPMIGVNEIQQEQFSLSNADQLKKFAEQKKLTALFM